MDTIGLIEAVKARPELYRKQASSTGNIDQKNHCWTEISEKIGQPVEKCKAKWRNLRDSYLKAVKWKGELEALGKLSKYREYKHEDALSFLGTGLKRKLSSDDKRSRM
jgi:Alcohol dehydrogenase transcription factor Myb/SANT-like